MAKRRNSFHGPTYEAEIQFVMNEDMLCYRDSFACRRVVLLHGWGADAEDLIPLGMELKSLSPNPLELVLLRAPHLHPQGEGRQWYGLFPPDWDAVPAAIEQLQDQLRNLPNDEIPLEKTVMIGFSQGGAMALASGCALPLAGLIGCSAYAHPRWSPAKPRPPVLLVHGKHDEIVPYTASEEIVKVLRESDSQGKSKLFQFQGGHEIPRQVIPIINSELTTWLD